jgi:L-lactate dehydrogenase complex protein LldG
MDEDARSAHAPRTDVPRVVAGTAVTAREEILARVSDALRDVPASERPEDVEIPRAYLRRESVETVTRFVARVSEYKTVVHRIRSHEIAGVVDECCRSRSIGRIGIPQDIPAEWIPPSVEAVWAEGLAARELDELDAALTGCALAIAETGTIVLDAGTRQGPRALTLVPDVHLCVVEESQILGGVPEAMAQIAMTIRRLGRPITFISGPSATSDIELNRVEGVHGPRTLIVLIVKEG